MAKQQRLNDLKPRPVPPVAHEPEEEITTDLDTGEAFEAGSTDEAEANDDPVLVKTGIHQVIVNGHVLDDGTVIEMKPSDVELHRKAGVPLHDVDDDYAGDVYDVSEPYAVPNSEEEAV